ncbi:endonuclease/exonuclease/phosphatase family protein [Alienimonas californiensis]|uniref:Endonuclease/exonuclease/phosphatase domain-containing protein n=1 Tax=Alienimonas californiensis TaxID=2527989 RepID=A0A517PB88_9PLAN|nr:endonuclease/exonuclease/phosphatase family protein [Alienimonas californiensis]QDT16611.1 hypothetical protein CA12_27170 [Alienimonas californiensis]
MFSRNVALVLVLVLFAACGCRPKPEADSPAVPEEFPSDPNRFPGHPDGFGPDPSAPAASVPTDRSADGDVVVATWNSGPLFSVADVQARTDDFAALAADVRPDVLLLDEVTSLAVARTVAEALGLPTGPEHVVVSDFNPNDEAQYSSLEVAILSRLPLANAVVFDRGPEGGARSG